MTTGTLNGNTGRPRGWQAISFVDFDVSWAGACPLNGGICFGSDDGRFLMMHVDGTNQQSLKEPIIASLEAINAIAFSNDHIAFSTRSDTVILPRVGDRLAGPALSIPIGSHGVISTPSGRFVSPLGREGIMTVLPAVGPEYDMFVSTDKTIPFNFYQIVALPVRGREFFGCAARLGGLLGLDLSGPTSARRMVSHRHENLDVVDVCAFGDNSAGLAAVCRDGTILLTKDVFSSVILPTGLRFPSVEGVPYRLLVARGHLLLLTNKRLYLMNDLVARFLDGQDVGHQPTSGRRWRMEAVDANVVSDRWLLVVLTRGVLQIDLDQLFLREATRNSTADMPFEDPLSFDAGTDMPFEDPLSFDTGWESSESYSEETDAALALV